MCDPITENVFVEKDVQHIPILLLLLLQLYPIRSAKCLPALAKTMLSIQDDEMQLSCWQYAVMGIKCAPRVLLVRLAKTSPPK